MCGIAGIINVTNREVNREQLAIMSRFLKERGPDDEGYWVQHNIGLANRRLSIIDLSKRGVQPMLDQEEKTVITFNGEIYNYLPLRKELEKEGIIFESKTDTEVLIYGYKVWGIEKLLKAIDGMFAFCIYDLQNNKIFLCRDRFGKKPLYYSILEDQLLFSSDIRSIYSLLDTVHIDYESLDYYLAELAVPQPKSIWKEIHQVKPAFWIEFDLISKKHFEKQYWELYCNPKFNLDYKQAEKLVEKALIKAILKRTSSDVPLGCFLSGGVDSGLIVALLAKNSPKKIKTFSVGFKEEEYNELPYARQLADRYNTGHTEIIIEPKIEKVIFDLVEYFGEPFADPSAIPTYYICKEMRKHITVALSGDGGDELFGYPGYTYMDTVDRFVKRYPTTSLRYLATKLANFGNRRSWWSIGYESYRKTYLNTSANSSLVKGIIAFNQNNKRDLYNKYLKNSKQNYTLTYMNYLWRKYKSFGNLADFTFRASLDTRLLNNYLVKVDRASMKNSLEVRSPFLDKDLAQLVFRMPNEYKFQDGQPKFMLKNLAKKYIDKDIFTRPKRGFEMPVKHWIKNELKPMIEENLSFKMVESRGFFNPTYVREIINEHYKNISDNSYKIWTLLWFELWCQRFLDKEVK